MMSQLRKLITWTLTSYGWLRWVCFRWDFGEFWNSNPREGHTQELKRHFSTLSLIGLASTTTISWTGLGLGIVTEIDAGGPGAIIYGFVLVTTLQCFLGASLAEFVSSYPTEGGMYHWIAAVAPKRLSASLSFITGWLTVCGCKFRQRVFSWCQY